MKHFLTVFPMKSRKDIWLMGVFCSSHPCCMFLSA